MIDYQLRRPRAALVTVLLGLSLGGCALWPATPQTDALLQSRPSLLRLEGRPLSWVQQDDNHCGPAALSMVMHQAGVSAPYERVISQVFTPGRQGSLQLDMLAAPRSFGLASYTVPPSLRTLLQLNADGTSPVVLLNLGLDILPRWHYAVVVGHDLDRHDIILTSGTHEQQVIPLKTFELMWARSGHWAMVVAQPERLPSNISAPEAEKTALAFERTNTANASAKLWAQLTHRWPDRLLPWLGLSHAQMQDQHWTEAKNTLLYATQHFDSAIAWNNLAQVWLALGDPSQALAAAEQARRRAQAAEPQWLSAIENTIQEIQK